MIFVDRFFSSPANEVAALPKCISEALCASFDLSIYVVMSAAADAETLAKVAIGKSAPISAESDTPHEMPCPLAPNLRA